MKDKAIERKMDEYIKKAKESKWKPPHVKHEPSSLERVIKTKAQADLFMKWLKEA